MIPRDDITGLVLAGGRGRRMGGVDKGLQNHRGIPMVQWAIERLGAQVAELILNANQNAAEYARFGHRVVADDIAARQRRRRVQLETVPLEVDAPDHQGSVALEHLLGCLDSERRAAFVLTQVLGYTYAEAAEVCDCPVGTIRSRVARARSELVVAHRAAQAS